MLSPLQLLPLASQDLIYEHCRRSKLGGAHQHSEGDLRLVDTWLRPCCRCLDKLRIASSPYFVLGKCNFSINPVLLIISEDLPLSLLHCALVLQDACSAHAYSMLPHCWVLTAWSQFRMPWGHTVLGLVFTFLHLLDDNGLCDDSWGFHVLCRCSNDLLATLLPFFPWW